MSDASKAASMFVLLGEEVASGIMKHLNESEIEQLSKEISNVGAITADKAEENAEELYQMLVANRFVSEGGVDYARKVILKTLGAGSAKRIIDRLSSSYASNNAFQSIDKVNPIQLSQFIQHEHPQTIALILAHLSARAGAELLESLPEEIQAEASVRMANIEEISPDVMSSIASVLEEKLKPVGNYGDGEGLGGIRAVAEMFNRLDRRMSRTVLEQIDGDKPEIAWRRRGICPVESFAAPNASRNPGSARLWVALSTVCLRATSWRWRSRLSRRVITKVTGSGNRWANR